MKIPLQLAKTKELLSDEFLQDRVALVSQRDKHRNPSRNGYGALLIFEAQTRVKSQKKGMIITTGCTSKPQESTLRCKMILVLSDRR